jgi:hypothetical protein
MVLRRICAALLVAGALALSPLGAAQATEDDGIVKFKSAYSMPETINRMKKDIANRASSSSTRSTRRSSPPMPG